MPQQRFRPSPAMIVAIVALIAALAPLASAGVNRVRRALFAERADQARVARFAHNAGKVRRIGASRTPEPGQLLALTRSGKFPASVIPDAVRGAKGEPGPPGDRGSPGPTAGYAAGSDNPPSSPTSTSSITITTPESGALFVFGHARAVLLCDAAGCTFTHGLYVDGAPVPGSARPVFAEMSPPPIPLDTFGLSATLPAGSHTVTLGQKQTSGAAASGTMDNAQVGAILLGSSGSALFAAPSAEGEGP